MALANYSCAMRTVENNKKKVAGGIDIIAIKSILALANGK